MIADHYFFSNELNYFFIIAN